MIFNDYPSQFQVFSVILIVFMLIGVFVDSLLGFIRAMRRNFPWWGFGFHLFMQIIVYHQKLLWFSLFGLFLNCSFRFELVYGLWYLICLVILIFVTVHRNHHIHLYPDLYLKIIMIPFAFIIIIVIVRVYYVGRRIGVGCGLVLVLFVLLYNLLVLQLELFGIWDLFLVQIIWLLMALFFS